MRALRYVALVALAVWIGGLVTLGGLVAPAVFATLEAEGAAGGRAMAGVLVGVLLDRFHVVGLGAGAVVLASLVARRLIGPRPTHFAARVLLLAAMLAATGYAGVALADRIEGTRRDAGGPASSRPATDATRMRFERLDAFRMALMGFGVVGGLALLGWEAAERH